MIIWNLTDVATAQLEQRQLVSHTFVVGHVVVKPGEHVGVTLPNTAALAALVQCGALAVDAPPPQYVATKRGLATVLPLDERPLPKRRKTK